MKLKTFEKVRTSVVTEYVVFKGDELVDYFKVDYCVKTADGAYDTKTLNASILKLMKYEDDGATVRFVDVNTATGAWSVTVEI